MSPLCLGKRLDSKPFLADVAGSRPEPQGPSSAIVTDLKCCNTPVETLPQEQSLLSSLAQSVKMGRFGPVPQPALFPHPWHHSTVGKVLGCKLGAMSKASKPHNEASFTTSHCLSILLTPPRNTGDRGHAPFISLGPM